MGTSVASLLVLLSALLWVPQESLKANDSRPQFSDYSVHSIYQGKSAPPVITHDWRAFRAMIRSGSHSGVEFAGHYTIPRWGCGTYCNAFVIVDSVTGKLYDGFSVVELSAAVYKDQGEMQLKRMEFYPNSRLLKISACPNEMNCGLYDYVMIEGEGLKLIRKAILSSR